MKIARKIRNAMNARIIYLRLFNQVNQIVAANVENLHMLCVNCILYPHFQYILQVPIQIVKSNNTTPYEY